MTYIPAAVLAELGASVTAEWTRRAACGGRARVMDPPMRKLDAASRNRAIAVCLGCAVLDDCRTWVMTLPTKADPGGICAALTESQRAQRRKHAKTCTGCRLVLPGTEFHGNPREPDGLTPYCKACSQQIRKAARDQSTR
ncbi:WhiB family transcriptional regulator [Actinomadura rubrisoli]|uniref:4Fe-4S Wbl-type domain-containing protein n=1 Tax=Actinomadura rubrisoli TaxID=2530368 RepID=A0A4V2YUG7_9ACTN|nr:WhiB family transcriptional regulator [Actinomadura rubrisoli]TDD77717.1 hypothetical protein E1298_29760 [Actinomadura rubrisoli]